MNAQDDSDIVIAATTQPAYRLSILDLMMGTVVVAAVLFLEQNFPIGRTGGKCKDPLWFVIFFSHAVATKSLVLFGLLQLGRSVLAGRKSDGRFFLNPGHVLLLSMFLSASQHLVTAVLWTYSTLEYSTGGMAMVLQFCTTNVLSILSVLVTLSAAVIGRYVFKWPWIWVTCLSLLSLLGFLGLISSAYFHYSAALKVAQRFGIGWGLYFRLAQITFYITSAFVVAAAVYDLVKGIRRDTPHWIGIAGWLVGSLVADLLLQIARLVLSTNDLYGI